MSRSRLLVAAALVTAVLVPAGIVRAEVTVELEHPRIDQGNEKSLQRGATAFVNYCMGCHSAGYNRYSRVAQDLGLSEEAVEKNLIHTTDENGEPTKVGALMDNNMTKEYGKESFGVVPPNLSLTARSRGTDWIYSYLKSYYLDPEKASTGVNNVVYPGTAMPNVLWNLQGWQVPVEEKDEHGEEHISGLKLEQPGELSPKEFDDLIADITNFMAYMADPIKEERHRIGLFVILFLLALLVVAWFLKKEYWKDVV